nr:M56 family metallopeptidase [uncultured Acetatifactor sp.]
MSEWVISASVLIVFVIAIRYFFRDRITMRVRYALWLLVAVRLLVPLSFAESGLSVLNYLAFREDVEGRDVQEEAKVSQGIVDVLAGAVRLEEGGPADGSGSLAAASADSGLSGSGAEQRAEGQGAMDSLQDAQSESKGEQETEGREAAVYRQSGQPGNGAEQGADGGESAANRQNGQPGNGAEQGADGGESAANRQNGQPGNGAEQGAARGQSVERLRNAQVGSSVNGEGSKETGGGGAASGIPSVSSGASGLDADDLGEPVEMNPDSAGRKKITRTNVLFCLWLIGVALFAGILAAMNGKYRKRVYISRRRFPTELESRLPVYVSSVVAAPCMFGLIRPAVYLNPRVAEDGRSLRYVLAHENTHYRHGDNLWVWVRAVCVCLHWYNPLVWLAACLSRQDGELACDERALEILGEDERIRYGRTLLDFSQQGGVLSGGLKLSTAMSGGKKQLKERLLMIVGHPRRNAGTLAAVMILTVLCSMVTFTGRVSGQEADIPEGMAGISGSGNDAEVSSVPVGDDAEGPADAAAESTSIAPIDLNDGRDYTLKIGGEAVPGSGEYRIDWIELNWIHDRTEETLQTICPEDVKVLYTRALEDIRSGDGKMWSYETAEEPLFAKPLRTAENLPAGEVGKFQADKNGLLLSKVVGGAVFVADLNFDGFQDFVLQGGAGEGNVPCYCYLWNPEQGKFVPGYMIPNLRVNEGEQVIESATDDGDGRRSTKYYRFDEYDVLHMVRYVEENDGEDALFPRLDLTYCETSYALPAVDEWDYGTRYGGALTERFVYWAREALTELYEWSGTKLDTLCFSVTDFGDFIFGNTPADMEASRTFYSRVYGARAGFQECIEQMNLVTERVVWYSPVTQWFVPEGMDQMSDLQLAEWYFGRSALTEGETIRQTYRDGEEFIVVTEAGKYYSIFLSSSTREAEYITGPYDSYPMH